MSRCGAPSTPDLAASALAAQAPARRTRLNHTEFGRKTTSPRRGFALAWLLLWPALAGLSLMACLPPDFEIDAAENRPIKIDKSLLT
ncbi:MAG TPA: hypothetical protein PK095_12035, partial [Myxococcota bacterium]|nr:hypothetical protein [Myxococcota bacterium]